MQGQPPAVTSLTAIPQTPARRSLIARMMNSQNVLALLLLAPASLILLLVFVYPLVRSLVLAFQQDDLTSPGSGTPFVGLANFEFLLRQSAFWSAIRITTTLTVTTVVLELVIGLGIALLLAERFVGSGLVRGLYLLPWALPAIVVSFGWRMYLAPGYGLVDTILSTLLGPFGLGKQADQIDWFGVPSLALLSVTVVVVWKGLPFVVLALLAGLQSLSSELDEAARIDGANGWQALWYVRLPQLRLIITIVLLLHIIGTFNGFDLPYLLTQGGPEGSTLVLAVDVYNFAFVAFQEGRAAALAVLMLIVLGALSYFLLMTQTSDESRA